MLKFLLVILLTCSTCYAEFILDSLHEAHQLSKSTKQPILVIFGSEDCVFCTKLKNDLTNNRFMESIDKYIVCYIDLKKYPEYKSKYKIDNIPDSRILINDKKVYRLIGYQYDKYVLWLKENK